jgi:hypothetical protein
MSKTTNQSNIATPIVIGGLILAAGILAAATLRRKAQGCDTVDAIVQTCEHALATLLERSSIVAA